MARHACGDGSSSLRLAPKLRALRIAHALVNHIQEMPRAGNVFLKPDASLCV
jgi:hypothetical protein